MEFLRVGLGITGVVAAMLSGVWWMKAANAKVLARTQAVGVGFGGASINVANEKGEILDFFQTFALQSKWNSRAARGSAVSAISAGLSFLLSMHPIG